MLFGLLLAAILCCNFSALRPIVGNFSKRVPGGPPAPALPGGCPGDTRGMPGGCPGDPRGIPGGSPGDPRGMPRGSPGDPGGIPRASPGRPSEPSPSRPISRGSLYIKTPDQPLYCGETSNPQRFRIVFYREAGNTCIFNPNRPRNTMQYRAKAENTIGAKAENTWWGQSRKYMVGYSK